VFTVGRLDICSSPTNTAGVASCHAGLSKELASLVTNRFVATFPGNSNYLSISETGEAVVYK
jgi:hypothetical protein